MQLADFGLATVSLAAVLLLGMGSPDSGVKPQAVTEAAVPVVEIRLGVGGSYIQVGVVWVRSAEKNSLELVLTAGSGDVSVIATPGSRRVQAPIE